MSTGERRTDRPRSDVKPEVGPPFRSLHDQFEELIAEVWKQEAWQRLEDRIDLAVRRLHDPAEGRGA